MYATCSNCRDKFKLKVKIKYHPRSVQEHHFTCKHCKNKHTAFFTDKTIRNKQKEMKGIKDQEKRDEMVKEITDRKEKLFKKFSTR